MKRRRKKQNIQKSYVCKIFGLIVAITVIAVSGGVLLKRTITESPEDTLVEYMNHIEKKEYEVMYTMIDSDEKVYLTKEEYIQRNSKIYEGIEVSDIKISRIAVKEKKADTVTLSYETSCNTIAGTIQFDNMAELKKTKQGYKLVWQDSLIFPDLKSDDKISVTTSKAERGEILDRDGKMLAGKGVATSVGIIPGKLEDRNVSIEKIAELLEIDVETINNKLTAKWVKEDSFVPIETIPKVEEIDLMKIQPEEKTLEEQDCQNKLLEIPGVMLSDVEVRTYELGEAAAHLIGYVQSVTAEDLENHPGEGYSAESVIGRSGVEKLYEKQLKGKDGCDIKILDSDGEVKEVLASIFKEDGMDIRLTIDSDLQKSLYEQFKEDPGCSVAMNPYTGEVLALVSTPSYDNNEFIRGLSSEKWTSLNEDEKKPLYNRFRQVWCPGSTFKPVVAGIGLKTGSIDSKEDFGNAGLAWQKDSSWGSYQVTTLHEYEPVIMKNAIIYSDNIYFAKAALKIGSENFMNTLNEIGFNQNMPFEIAMQESTYSNTDKIETEIQLADSGYGQGQILVNPLHLASIYTSFLNEGNMIKPYLKYKEEASGETWIENAFSKENVEEIMQGVEGVVNDPEGTGYAAHRDDILLAGKTGTAELKATKEDTSGKEIGWFSVFTADKSVDKPILLISMVENVKGIGGSGYVVKKDATVLEEYPPPGFDGAPGETGFRVQPLDKTCRELNRKYVMPLGYALNNLLITNWDNQNYTELDFYDLYEKMYYMKYGKQVPYEANYGGVEYEVPEDEFEEVIKTYLPFSNTEIEKGTFYNSDNRTFRYRPRGLYDCEFPYEPYPEVISYEKLQDGTLKLTIEAVWEIRMLDQAITSELMIKPMEDGSFQYLSNKVIKSDQNANAGWYMPRLTEEEWEENYSNN